MWKTRKSKIKLGGKKLKKLASILLAAVIAVSTAACSNNEVATVNGKSISSKEIENQLKFQKWMMESQYGEEVWTQMEAQDKNYQETMKKQVATSVSRIRAFTDYAEKNGVKPDQKQLKEFQAQNKKMLEDEKMKKSFEKTGLDEKFLDDFAKEKATMVSLSKYLKKKSKPTEKELKDYYEKNSVKAKAAHILLTTTDTNGKPLSPEKKAEVKKKADKIYEEAKSGVDFKELAKKNSQDPGSAQNGGELGEFGKGQMVPEFEKAVFSMKEGEISKPIETQYGYHIIKLEKIVKSEFDKVKAEMEAALSQEKAQKLAQSIIDAAKIQTNEENLKKVSFGKVEKKSKKEAEPKKPADDKKDTKEEKK